jgi:hypothetical protein
MNINRHNYEAFFLVYVDGELSPAERAAVEAFARQNPDLAEELKMLKQTVLPPADDVTFEGKQNLLRTASGITPGNFEEYFLLAVDNELTDDESTTVEKFVLQHPELQDEFTTLQATRLPAETIEYKRKEELYRHEKERRIIPVMWMRMSAAAAIIILLAGTWFTQSDKLGNVDETKSLAHSTQTNKPVNVTPKGNQQVPKAEQPSMAAEEINKPGVNITSIGTRKLDAGMVQVKKTEQTKSDNRAVEPIPQKIKLLPPTPEMLAGLIGVNQPKEEITILPNTGNVASPNQPLASTAGKAVSTNEPSIITHAVYKDMDDEDDDNIILVGSAEINKNKLKSLLGKASGLFRKKAKSDDEENTISIANFQLKSK